METKFLHGAVLKLTREDTRQSILQNFQQMKENGLDTVVIWPAVYWWEEKKPGYPFNTGRLVLELAEQTGLGVIMEVAGQLPMMEYIPDFQMKEEYFCVDEYGKKRVEPNSFGWLNYFHPEVDRLICDNFTQTARAYKDYPALIAYDVFNETAFNSYDEYTMGQFRLWLKEKYGTVEKLNEAWEHSYTDFSQVTYVPWMWMSILPAADMGAFRKEAVGIFLKRWCDAIRAVDPSHPLIADNIGSMVTGGDYKYQRPQDDFVLGEVADEIGMSFYPKQVKGCQPPHGRWCTFDGFFAASGRKGYYISEMQTHTQAMFNPTTAVRPWELKQWCYEALASGIKGMIYWMWRAFDKGLQTGGRGLVDYQNRSTPRLEIVRSFGQIQKEMGTLRPVPSRIGIVFDGRCQDFQMCYTKCYGVDKNIYSQSVCGAYRALYEAGARADIIQLQEMDHYDVIILTNHLIITEETAHRLKRFVRNGGTVLCDGKIGVVDALARMHDLLPGGPFRDVMGLEYIDSDYETLSFGNGLSGCYGRELTAVTDGQVLARFDDGYPAVVEKTLGKGKVVTVNTFLWYGAAVGEGSAKAFAEVLAEKYAKLRVSAPLKARLVENGKEQYAIVFNYTDSPVKGWVKAENNEVEVCVDAQDVRVVRI